MLSIVPLNVIILNVVAPTNQPSIRSKFSIRNHQKSKAYSSNTGLIIPDANVDVSISSVVNVIKLFPFVTDSEISFVP